MKTIQPVTVWVDGLDKQATVLSAFASGDNLSNAASFSYQLLTETNSSGIAYNGLEQVASGQLTMTGSAYDAWETNDYAYDWVAEQLNLTITGEYVPPTPPEPTPEPIV